MATSEENDLIGYDPLAWMEGSAGNNEDSISDDASQAEEPQLIDDEAGMADEAGDDWGDTDWGGNEQDVAIEDEGDGAIVDEVVAEVSVVEEETEGSQIDLDATLTIQNVVSLHEKLKQILAAHDEIEINASDVASIDTATLQLLVSLKKDAVKLKKAVSIIYPSPRFVESARLLGLLEVLDVDDV
ncbi:MAG: STAS domain-containing protein [Methylobacter sp.]